MRIYGCVLVGFLKCRRLDVWTCRRGSTCRLVDSISACTCIYICVYLDQIHLCTRPSHTQMHPHIHTHSSEQAKRQANKQTINTLSERRQKQTHKLARLKWYKLQVHQSSKSQHVHKSACLQTCCTPTDTSPHVYKSRRLPVLYNSTNLLHGYKPTEQPTNAQVNKWRNKTSKRTN